MTSRRAFSHRSRTRTTAGAVYASYGPVANLARVPREPDGSLATSATSPVAELARVPSGSKEVWRLPLPALGSKEVWRLPLPAL